ncbi:acyltransferase [Skermania sp. ID1734]|uniref:acyltransferase family protein n=1 Tax=Skermania sp. ID1734 TaxID=2597516 RepID=UPI00118EC3AB|nr:acyltransferase family protein [Skermania sp. ID1734]TSD94460.1 acyltransferase [Skermania sp. ID1734]
MRVEIQALRALAVMLVVVYHMEARLVPGGYVGVDVFYVISGFLITSHIAEGLQSSRGFRITDFYVRRARRLLPAALTVLAVVGLVTVFALPQAMWNTIGRQLLASTFYVQNWLLAFASLNYLAGATAASPLEHFWSLSVEEQFYLVWPVLLMAAAWYGRRTGQLRRMLAASVAVVVVVSFAYSVWITSANPTWAFFITPTRMWELGLGGLLGLTIPELRAAPNALRIALSWLGYFGILASALLLNATTMFPGYIAAVPVLSTALVITAGDVPGRLSTSWLAGLRPVQFVGDISYSIYLWHWPLIALTPVLLLGPGSTLPAPLRPLPVLAAVLLAWLSKKWIEDPFRRPPKSRVETRRARTSARPLLAGIGALALVVVAIGSVIYTTSQTKIDRALASLSAFDHGPRDCAGAAALVPACAGHSPPGIHPDPIIAANDIGGQDCQQEYELASVIRCDFGITAGARAEVAVLGDSHASQWLPAIRLLAEQRGWHVRTYLKGACPYAEGIGFATCQQFDANVQAILDRDPVDIAFTSARSGFGYGSDATHQQAVDGFARAWRDLMAHGTHVVAIADTPQPYNAGIFDPAGRVEASGSFSYPLARGLGASDALGDAARKVGATLLDMNAGLCSAGTCPAVIGGVLVYADYTHITATYIRTLAPSLGEALDKTTSSQQP